MARKPSYPSQVAALLREIAEAPSDEIVTDAVRSLARRALDDPSGLVDAEVDALSDALSRYRLRRSGV